MLARIGVVAVLGLSVVACGVGRHVQKGIHAYDAGSLQRALEIWSDLDHRQPEMNEKGRVRYLVYRGLTHHRLGQHRLALTYLARGNAAYRAGNPRWLSYRAVQQMEAALRQSGGEPATAPPPAMPAAPVEIE